MRSACLETERLFLRRPNRADVGTLLGQLRSGIRQVASAPLAGDAALAQTVAIVCQWDLCGFGLFAVLPKGSDTPIGLVGPWHPTGWPAPELGWMIADNADADTLAPEALRAARHFAARDLGWRDIVSHIATDDRRAMALVRASGAIADPYADAPFGARVVCHPSAAPQSGWRRAA